MNGTVFSCPVCRSPLSQNGRSFTCRNNHCYDISKEGYVNLLLANMKQSREPGNSKEMLEARQSFLNKGYYKPLARSVTSLIIKYRKRSQASPFDEKMSFCRRRDIKTLSQEHDFNILDAGCGEGYYSDYISRNKYAGDSSVIYGVDISKEGIKSAAKRNGRVNYAVAGIYHLPVLDDSIDILLNIFAPFNETEFGRVLKEKGNIISVTPGARHLYELKQNLYDDVYLNDEKFNVSERFYIAETVRVQYDLNITVNTDISNLLKMTPYYHKTEPVKINSFLENTVELKTAADFLIRVISKKIT